MEESATYQWILRKGERKAYQETILRQGRQKFGEPVPAVIEEVQAITDLGRLRQLAVRILDASSWDDLLVTPEAIR